MGATLRQRGFQPRITEPQLARRLRTRPRHAAGAGARAAPEFSVIICSLNGARVLPACLRSLAKLRGPTHEIIVVDNGSTDDTARIARRCAGVRLIRTGQNLGFAGGNNIGLLAARGTYLVLLNDDTEVPADWLLALKRGFERDARAGAVGCKLVYPNQRRHDDPRERVIQHAGGVIQRDGNTRHLGYGEADRGQWDAPAECDYVTGAALALRRAALQQVGLLDPGYFPIYYEETDLQTRMRQAGWTIRYEPAAWLVHHESQSQGAGSATFVYRYTKNRLRYLALNGFPGAGGWPLGAELKWLAGMIRAGRLGPVLRAYATGLRQWRAWRAGRIRVDL